MKKFEYDQTLDSDSFDCEYYVNVQNLMDSLCWHRFHKSPINVLLIMGLTLGRKDIVS